MGLGCLFLTTKLLAFPLLCILLSAAAYTSSVREPWSLCPTKGCTCACGWTHDLFLYHPQPVLNRFLPPTISSSNKTSRSCDHIGTVSSPTGALFLVFPVMSLGPRACISLRPPLMKASWSQRPLLHLHGMTPLLPMLPRETTNPNPTHKSGLGEAQSGSFRQMLNYKVAKIRLRGSEKGVTTVPLLACWRTSAGSPNATNLILPNAPVMETLHILASLCPVLTMIWC